MEEAMGGHVMVPLENLSLEIPNGGLKIASESVNAPPSPSAAYKDVKLVLEHDKEMSAPVVSSLQEEISALRSRQRYLDRRRREALDKLIDLKGSIRVFCRVRPVPSAGVSPVSIEPEKITVHSAGAKKDFSVDRVFDQESTQEEVFQEVKPILRSALDGHNVCILAYGQTGTGKTYTMEGTNSKLGIVPRAIRELFSHASEDISSAYALSISMLEVYMGNLRDLLAPKQNPSRSMESIPRCNLSILATTNGAVEVEGLTDVEISDLKKANQWYCKGRRARSTCWTHVNDVSSRSHCLTRVTIRRIGVSEEVISKLWLVDLGGSERLLKTGASGLTMDEGKAINLSLSALGDVIAALRRKKSHVPYRNSKLTQILSDSLGDGSKVLMVVHISPSEDDAGETVCSLSFAKRARLTESTRELSEDSKMQRQKRMAELDRQIHNTEEEIQNVTAQIEKMQNLIQEKKLSPAVCPALIDEKGSPRSTLVAGHIDVAESPQTAEKLKCRTVHQSVTVPHFMASTVCSRQRHSASNRATGGARSATTKSGNRMPANLAGSQSFSCSSHHLTPSCKNTKSCRPAVSFGSSVPRLWGLSSRSDQINVSNNSIDSTAASAPQRRESYGSRPAPKARSHRHRRRMSDVT